MVRGHRRPPIRDRGRWWRPCGRQYVDPLRWQASLCALLRCSTSRICRQSAPSTYERLGLPVTYEGDEYPDFIAFGVGDMEFGIQQSPAPNDLPSVLTWQIVVSDVDAVLELRQTAGLPWELEHNNPAPGWSYRRIILETPSGYRLVLEGPNEARTSRAGGDD